MGEPNVFKVLILSKVVCRFSTIPVNTAGAEAGEQVRKGPRACEEPSEVKATREWMVTSDLSGPVGSGGGEERVHLRAPW